MPDKVAVIDIGSNTIKLLVASKEPHGTGITTLLRRTIEARLGKGISGDCPAFSREVIERGAEVVAQLVGEARALNPEAIQIVATSAARDAQNREELAAAIAEKTGLHLEILSGQREAELIGAAVQLDEGVRARDFYVFDLGGGSLECLRFRDRRLEQVVSLQLGAVRLAEKLLGDPAAPFTEADERRVTAEVQSVIEDSCFDFSLPHGSLAIGTGGTLTCGLEILAMERGRKMEEVPPFLSQENLRHLLRRIGPLPLSQRLQVEKLSPGRADVFPTALATFLALLDLAGLDGLHHSLLNLRYGLAAELLI